MVPIEREFRRPIAFDVVAVTGGAARTIIRRETVADLLDREVDPQDPAR